MNYGSFEEKSPFFRYYYVKWKRSTSYNLTQYKTEERRTLP